MRMKFLLDENLSPDFVAAIQQRDPTIDIKWVRGPETPPEGTLDPEVLLFCEAEQRALITNNRASMPGHEAEHFAAGHHHYGILQLHVGHSFGEYVDAILLFDGASETEEWIDRTEWIPLR